MAVDFKMRKGRTVFLFQKDFAELCLLLDVIHAVGWLKSKWN